MGLLIPIPKSISEVVTGQMRVRWEMTALDKNRDEVDAIECKWDPMQFDPAAIKLFRSYYPQGNNYLLSPITVPGYPKKVSGLDIYVCNPEGWRKRANDPL